MGMRKWARPFILVSAGNYHQIKPCSCATNTAIVQNALYSAFSEALGGFCFTYCRTRPVHPFICGLYQFLLILPYPNSIIPLPTYDTEGRIVASRQVESHYY